ncbi:hypothetical protein [Microcoleus sp. EPA2]|uniref:hypothetical protein n=1 Tax=Microcoleus sp. EPA2 TaxID=2841654 RepID=UPI00312BA474
MLKISPPKWEQMTSAGLKTSKTHRINHIGIVIDEGKAEASEDITEQLEIQWRNVGEIFSNLTSSVNFASACILKANSNLSSTGVKLHGAGFILTKEEAIAMGYQIANKKSFWTVWKAWKIWGFCSVILKVACNIGISQLDVIAKTCSFS